MSGPLGSSQWMYASGAAVTQQSLKFNDDESQYLSWTPAAAGNRKTWTWSGWVKRGNIGTTQDIFIAGSNASGQLSTQFTITSGNILQVYSTISGSSAAILLQTTQVFRDPSAWYHFTLTANTTDGTASNRVKLYVNGEQVTSFSTATYPSQNYDTAINNNVIHTLGRFSVAAANHFDGYLSDVYFIDGQALDPTSFGQFTDGYWEAKDYAGTYGTNGFHLTFQDDVVSEGFNAVTYRGTGASQSVSGLGLNPDLVWMKRRTADDHDLQDSVRGGGKTLMSNSTAAELNLSGSYGVNSFDADGFSLIGNGGRTNESGSSYVAWCWDAGSGSPVSNTDGSITSTVKANPSYGFSITSFVGNGTLNATTGHGLSSTPEMVLVKNRSTTVGWLAWHKDLSGATYRMDLNGTGAEYNDGNGALQGVSSSLLTLGSLNAVNQNSANMIAYCFHSVAGYSSIGSYSGTGAAGNAVTTGFPVAFVMIKRTDSTSNWSVFDNTRNVNGSAMIRANLSNAETDGDLYPYISFTSTGFTHLAYIDSNINVNGATYIYMAFADTREAAFWKDVSGNNNHWTPSGLDYRDSLIDSPANNFAVLNPLTGEGTAQEGNLKVAANDNRGFYSSFAMESGKWYWEAVMVSGQPLIGVIATELHVPNSVPNSSGQHTIFYYFDGRVFQNGALLSTEASFAAGDIIGVTYDANTYEIKLYKNNSFQRTITANNQYTYAPACTAGSVSAFWTFNFGQDSTFSGARPAGGNQDDNGIGDFAYAPPSGYLALCTANLPTPTIVDGSTAFNTVLWTGNGSHIDVGFDPEFLWYKARNVSSYGGIVDSIRGDNVYLQSYSTNAEVTSSGLLVTDSTGFTPGSAFSTNSYVSWNWKAGGTPTATNTAGVGAVPTSGSVMIDGVASTSSLAGTIAANKISANTAAGFSIINYTGNGLSGQTVPEFLIMKDRGTNSNNGQWQAWHKSAGDGDDYGYLSTTNAFTGDAQIIPNGTDTIELKVNLTTSNQSGHSFIMYAFHSVEGYCKAGRYIGNGSTDGPYIHLGFRASWIMVKSTGASNWFIWDTSRNPYNATTTPLFPNSSSAEEATLYPIDILSNGFKLRGASGLGINESATYIYLAFAENPFKYANAR
jgi:hypothetical protein